MKITSTIFIICTSLLFLPNIPESKASSSDPSTKDIKSSLKIDAFDPQLYKNVKSIDQLLDYAKKDFKGEVRSAAFIKHLAETIKDRFYHGFSKYTLKDNWIAALAGELVWQNLSSIVYADDIMKYPYAACSQQSIVLTECAKRLGLNYRKVGFDHHYATEIQVDHNWYYVDPNFEIVPEQLASLEELLQTNRFKELYLNQITSEEYEQYLSHPFYGTVNEEAAPKARIFHSVSSWLSIYLINFLIIVQMVMLYSYYSRKHNGPSLNLGLGRAGA